MLIDTCILLVLMKWTVDTQIESGREQDPSICASLCFIATLCLVQAKAALNSKTPNGDMMAIGYALVPFVPLTMMLVAVIMKIYEVLNVSWTLAFSFMFELKWFSYDLGMKASAFSLLTMLLTVLDWLNMVNSERFFPFFKQRKEQAVNAAAEAVGA